MEMIILVLEVNGHKAAETLIKNTTSKKNEMIDKWFQLYALQHKYYRVYYEAKSNLK